MQHEQLVPVEYSIHSAIVAFPACTYSTTWAKHVACKFILMEQCVHFMGLSTDQVLVCSLVLRFLAVLGF